MTARHWILVVASVLTMAAVYWAPDPEDALVTPAKRETKSTGAFKAPSASSGRPVHVLTLKDREEATDFEEFFTSVDGPAPVRQVRDGKSNDVESIAAEPPADLPPPPFRVIGRYTADGQDGVFLTNGDKSLVAHVGDTLDGNYRLEAVSETELTLRYLPLDRQQTIVVGAAR